MFKSFYNRSTKTSDWELKALGSDLKKVGILTNLSLDFRFGFSYLLFLLNNQNDFNSDTVMSDQGFTLLGTAINDFKSLTNISLTFKYCFTS